MCVTLHRRVRSGIHTSWETVSSVLALRNVFAKLKESRGGAVGQAGM